MRVVSFFAGCGGLDLGFRQAGFDVVWANEFEQHCQATYQLNHPDTKFVLDDVRNIDPQSIPDCDGFIGGPPCQSWSVGGKQRGLDDERGQLFIKYIDLIKVKKPAFFVIENVKGMLDNKFKDIFDDFIHRLENAGYDVTWSLVDACDYGIPQNRERVFFLGFRKDLHVSYSFPDPFTEEPISLQRAIGDISEPPNPCIGKRRMGHYSDRANHDVLVSKFGPFYFRGNRRRGWHQPSFTINATAEFAPLHPSSPKMMFFGHENWNFQSDKLNEYRRLSLRECARIQTFPDSFIFSYDNISAGYKMIGNAVPPRLAKIIALSILKVLNKSNNQEPAECKDILGENSVIVGYYKNDHHRKLIQLNQIYYIRSDGRKGSMYKVNNSMSPKYLLLHHNEDASLYELDGEEAVVTDSSYLKSLGFKTSGEKYLCFRLKTGQPILDDINKSFGSKFNYDKTSYSPYFSTIEMLMDPIKPIVK